MKSRSRILEQRRGSYSWKVITDISTRDIASLRSVNVIFPVFSSSSSFLLYGGERKGSFFFLFERVEREMLRKCLIYGERRRI